MFVVGKQKVLFSSFNQYRLQLLLEFRIPNIVQRNPFFGVNLKHSIIFVFTKIQIQVQVDLRVVLLDGDANGLRGSLCENALRTTADQRLGLGCMTLESPKVTKLSVASNPNQTPYTGLVSVSSSGSPNGMPENLTPNP